MSDAKKIFVLDTSVIMYEPETAYTAFKDNDVIVPIIVFYELDNLKNHPNKGNAARVAINRFNELVGDGDSVKGVTTPGGGILRLDADGNYSSDLLPKGFDPNKADNLILQTTKAISKSQPGVTVILVTKDNCLRLIARGLGLNSQDYLSGRAVEKSPIVKSTVEIYVRDEVIDQICMDSNKGMLTIDDAGIVEEVESLRPNACLRLIGKLHVKTVLAIFSKADGRIYHVPKPRNQPGKRGIYPRNEEQAFALELTRSPRATLVTLAGPAGTGKSLMALLAGWKMLHNQNQRPFERYALEDDQQSQSERKSFCDKKIVVFRPTREIGAEMGFLPGTLEEKFAPWERPVLSNLRLICSEDQKDNEHLKGLFETGKIEIMPINHIRGDTVNHALIIVDDAQNLTPSEIKAVITRVGEGSRIIITGDPTQVDVNYLDEYSNGFSHVVARMAGKDITAHLDLFKGERSKLAEIAAELL